MILEAVVRLGMLYVEQKPENMESVWKWEIEGVCLVWAGTLSTPGNWKQ